MLKETQKHLDDLKAAGFDIGSLETQIKDPILEKQADRLIGGGILRQQEFNQYMTRTTEEKKALEAQVTKLAALHDSADSLKGNDAVYQEALKVIAAQEEALIAGGWDEEEVKALSLKAVPALKAKIDTASKTEPIKKEEENGMPTNFDPKNYIDLETYQAGGANLIYGSVALNAKVQAAMLKAQQLGIPLTDENINSLAETIRKTVEAGGTIDTAIDINFGISTKEKEVDIENQKKAVAAAREEGLAQGRKEGGIPTRMVSRETHPLSKLTHVKTEDPEKVDLNNVPKNKFGDTEIYRTRGDKNSRIENAEAFHEKVLQREGNLMAAE